MAGEFDFADIISAFDPKLPANIKVTNKHHRTAENKSTSKHVPLMKAETISIPSLTPSLSVNSIDSTQKHKNIHISRDYSATDAMLRRLNKRKRDGYAALNAVIMSKTNNDPFGTKSNGEGATLLCPWCGEKKGFSIMSRHLYTKCIAKPAHIRQAIANASKSKRITRSNSRVPTRNHHNNKTLDNANSSNSDLEILNVNQAETKKSKSAKTKTKSSSNSNVRRNKKTGQFQSKRSRVKAKLKRRKPQPSDDEEYVTTSTRRINRGTKRRRT